MNPVVCVAMFNCEADLRSILNRESIETPFHFRLINRDDSPNADVLVGRLTSVDSSLLEKQRRFRADRNPIGFVVLADKDCVVEAAASALLGGIILPAEPNPLQLLQALQQAAAVCRQRRSIVLELQQVTDQLESLSPRQREVFEAAASGDANKQIAARMHISVKTVEKHRQEVNRRLGTRNAAGLGQVAARLNSSLSLEWLKPILQEESAAPVESAPVTITSDPA